MNYNVICESVHVLEHPGTNVRKHGFLLFFFFPQLRDESKCVFFFTAVTIRVQSSTVKYTTVLAEMRHPTGLGDCLYSF